MEESETRGLCEFHGEWASNLSPIRIKEEAVYLFLPNFLERSVLTNPFLACSSCREIIARVGKDGVEQVNLTTTNKDEVQIPITDNSSHQERMVKRFADLKKIFPKEVRDIYLVPEDEVASTEFANKLNLVVDFYSISMLEYTKYVLTDRRSAMHLWNKSTTRFKFFGARTLRILIGLTHVHLSSIELAIWVKSYTRIISMNYICGNPPRMQQLTPSRLLKVT